MPTMFSLHSRGRGRLLSLLLLSIVSIAAELAAQPVPDKLAHTLLWRIERADRPGPSYLFGTMHLSDARIFNLRDSVLPALLSCRTVAFELSFDRTVTDLLNLYLHPDSTIDLREELSAETYALYDAYVQQTLNLPAGYLRHLDPELAYGLLSEMGEGDQEEPFSPRLRPGRAMKEVVLDVWLARTAQLEGKSVVGLETIAEQITAVAALPFDQQIKRLADYIEAQRSTIQREALAEHLRGLLDGSTERGRGATVLAPPEESFGEVEGADRYEMPDLSDVSTTDGGVTPSQRRAEWRREHDDGPRDDDEESDGERLVEEMITLYLAEDAGALLRMVAAHSDSAELVALLDDRNHVMAERLDTLIGHGTTFAAVGAGHLAGEQGLIALMRRRGYAVTPVLSERSGAAEEYRRPKRTIPWHSIDEGSGYRVDLPTIPIDYPAAVLEDAERQSMRMWMSSDIFTTLTYLVVERRMTPEELLGEDLFESIATSFFPGAASGAVGGGMIMQRKDVTTDGVRGKEFSGISGEGEMQRIRLYQRGTRLIALVVTGAGILRSRDDSRFLESIRFTVPTTQAWESYRLDGFRSGWSMPAGGVADTLDEQWIGGIHMSVVRTTALDQRTGITYVVTHGVIPPTLNAFDDALIEQGAATLMMPGMVDVRVAPLSPPTGVRRLGSFSYSAPSGMTLTSQVALRGPHVIVVSTIRPTGVNDISARERFFAEMAAAVSQGEAESAAPREIAYPDYGFAIALHDPIVDDTKEDSIARAFSYYDYTSFTAGRWREDEENLAIVVSYSPYKDAVDADSLWREFRAIVEWTGTIIAEKSDTAAGLEWRDYVIRSNHPSQSPRIMRERIALHGGRRYRLRWAAIDSTADPARADSFFASFRLLDPEPVGDLFSRKVDRLLADLFADDPLTAAIAANSLDRYPFRPDDLPAVRRTVRRLLREPRPVDTDSGSRAISSLLRQFDESADRESVPFLAELYDDLPDNHAQRSEILGALARMRTEKSLDVLKELFAASTSTSFSPYDITGPFYGDLRGIDALYPALLEHRLAQSEWTYHAALLTTRALDSGAITLASIMSWRERIEGVGASSIRLYRNPPLFGEAPDQWDVEALIELLARLPADGVIDDLLDDLVTGDATDEIPLTVRRAAATALLRHGKEVAPARLADMAASPYQRIILLDDLEVSGLKNHFPAEYATQVRVAEGMLTHWMTESEGEDVELAYVADRVVEWKGAPARAYLFRGRYVWSEDEEDAGEWYPAISIQPRDPSQTSTEEGRVFVTWETFDPLRLDHYFETMMLVDEQK